MVPLVYALRSPNICHKQRDCESLKKDNFKKSEKTQMFHFIFGGIMNPRKIISKSLRKKCSIFFWWEEINARQEEEFGDVLRSKWDDKGTTHLF